MQNTKNQTQMMDTPDAATYLGVKEPTLRSWRQTKRIELPYVRIGRSIRYRKKDLDAFMKKHTVGSVED